MLTQDHPGLWCVWMGPCSCKEARNHKTFNVILFSSGLRRMQQCSVKLQTQPRLRNKHKLKHANKMLYVSSYHDHTGEWWQYKLREKTHTALNWLHNYIITHREKTQRHTHRWPTQYSGNHVNTTATLSCQI